MKNKKTFRKGQVVISGTNAILVTGKGNKNESYPVFAGVVIMAIKKEDERPWPIGMYSDTWSTKAFRKVDIKLSKLVANSLNVK
jgi:hypothetical protein